MEAFEIKAKIEKIKAMSGISEKAKADMIAAWENKMPAEKPADENDEDYERQYDSAPNHIKYIIDSAWGDKDHLSYAQLKKLNNKLKTAGWKIDYGLDGGITSLKPMSVEKGKKERKKKPNKAALKARIKAEIKKSKADSSYENDDAENEIFAGIYLITGYDPQFPGNEKDAEYLSGSNNTERLQFALLKLDPAAKISSKKSNFKTKTTHKYKGKTVPELDDKDCEDLIKETQERRKKAAKAEKKSKSRPIIEKVTVPIVKAVKKVIENIPAADLKDDPKKELSMID